MQVYVSGSQKPVTSNLTLHATGQYCKQICGKMYYFGTDRYEARERIGRFIETLSRDPDCDIDLVFNECRRSWSRLILPSDAVYLYEVYFEGHYIYKIGVTSVRCNTRRIEQVIRKMGVVARNIHIWEVPDPHKVEKDMLVYGELQTLYAGDGHTEMRFLSDIDVRQVKLTAEKACTGEVIRIEELT